MTYDFDVRNAAMNPVRMTVNLLSELLAEAGDHQNHRLHHWVRKLAFQGTSNSHASSSLSSATKKRKGRQDNGPVQLGQPEVEARRISYPC